MTESPTVRRLELVLQMTDAPPEGQPQRQMSKAEERNRDLAAHPEKAVLYIWLLLGVGLFQRFVMPAIATDGIVIVSAPLVILVLIGPAFIAGVVFYYNKKLTALGKAVILGSAAVITVFGMYLLVWSFN
jgi:hypothetical protein